MKNNQRGEITTVMLVLVAIVSVVGGAALSSKYSPLKMLFKEKSAANKKASWTKQTEHSTPVLLTDKAGKPVAVGTKIERVYDTGMEDSKPAPTYGEQVANFFAGLTNWGFLIIVALAILAPGTLIGFFAKRYRDYRALAKTMVAGVKAAPADAADAVKTEIAIKQDTKQKKMVAKLKGELQ